MPGDYAKQGNCYSSYKHYCTLKILIGVTPAGGACFISPPFEGATSDRQIFSGGLISEDNFTLVPSSKNYPNHYPQIFNLK